MAPDNWLLDQTGVKTSGILLLHILAHNTHTTLSAHSIDKRAT